MEKDPIILIVDDVEMNRELLKEMFSGVYRCVEAENGREALDRVQEYKGSFAAILLDIIMPVMDGFQFLQEMKKRNMLEQIPVFLITADSTEAVAMKGYEMGVVDVIANPFNPYIVRKRLGNVIELYQYRNRLEEIVEYQTAELEAQTEKLKETNRSIIETLSMVIEFRDWESGEHVQRIRDITNALLVFLSENYHEQYPFTQEQIDLITEAAVMHDVGKISIPDYILNKPGRLTEAEYEIMKEHTIRGCEILESIDGIRESDMYQYCLDICRYHHERWDGQGYPDHLRGNQIPVSAQVVSIADVYDALMSKRVYKEAYSQEKTVQMILNGECGAFNPVLLNCFEKIADKLYQSFYAGKKETVYPVYLRQELQR